MGKKKSLGRKVLGGTGKAAKKVGRSTQRGGNLHNAKQSAAARRRKVKAANSGESSGTLSSYNASAKRSAARRNHGFFR